VYICILDEKGEIREHRNLKTDRDAFLKTIAPYREDIVVAVECIFTWYWVADLCHNEGIPWRKSKKRQDRLPKDRRTSQRRHDAHGLCVSSKDEGNA